MIPVAPEVRTDDRPLEPGPPVRLLGWVRGANASRHRALTPIWLRVALTVVGTLGLGTWGFLDLSTKPRLGVLQSVYGALKLYTFDLGAANASSPGPNWQLWVALLLAGGLVARGVLALARERVRRATARHLLHGHVVVCGAGVHGTRIVEQLCDRHDVVLVDSDPGSAGMQTLRGPYEWRLVGDCVTERTLLAAGARRAHWLIAVTGNDFVNSQIVSAMRSLVATGRARDGVHVLVQMEDPSLTRFLEEESEAGYAPAPVGAVAGSGPSRRPVVSPFSANAIAAEALLEESRVRLAGEESTAPLVAMRDGLAPNLLLAGDHPLIDALVLAALRRWRVRILRELEADTGRNRPPMHISVYGPGAEQRVQRLRARWLPEPSVLTLEGRDSPPPGDGPADTDGWLLKRGGVAHAIVACHDELDGIGLTLSLARALGNRARMTRVTTQFENALDAHVEERTARSPYLATTEVKSLADLGAKPEQMSRLPGAQRLIDALDHDHDRPAATLRTRALLARTELGIRSDSSWRVRGCERDLLEPLLELNPPLQPVPLSAMVRAGLRIELDSAHNLLTAARRLTARGDPAAFMAWCEYVRHLGDDSAPADLAGLEQPTGDPVIDRLLALRRATFGHRGALDALNPDPDALAGVGRLTIIAGAAGSMSLVAQREHEPLLERALTGYDGVILSGGTAVGVPGIVGRIAQRHGLQAVGYTPTGMAATDLYSSIRETPGVTEFSVREPLMMWTDILSAGLPAGQVRLLAGPGGTITHQEIVLARALGARVGWLDPVGEAPQPLDDMLPLGSQGVLELPIDPMTVRAFISSSRCDEALRETVARFLHNAYRRAQRGRKAYGDPALARWNELPPVLQASNLAQADDIPNKLALVGRRLIRAGGPLELTAEQIELLAEVEHGRWNIERLSAGWRVGDRQVGRSTSPDLKPWAELSDHVREYDREAVRNIPIAIADAGWGVSDG